jgi:hypothetical protein
MEYNGLVLLDYMRQSELCRYDYALCHGCGLVYATRRPDGDELQFLTDHFDEFLGRDRRKAAPLSADERADIERPSSAWMAGLRRA